MTRVTFVVVILFAVVRMASAQQRCINPPPVFDCSLWHREDDGRLVTNKALTAGLLGLQENAYIGDGTIIDGIDYGKALKRQCDNKKS